MYCLGHPLLLLFVLRISFIFSFQSCFHCIFFILLSFFFSFSTPPPTSSLHPPLTHIQLSNGFDHYSPTSSPYQHSNGGSSGSATAFPFFPTPSSPSTSSPTRSWPRPASALLPDYPPYCTLGPMIPSSKVPSWKVCLLTSVDFSPIQRQSVLFLQLQCCAISHWRILPRRKCE